MRRLSGKQDSLNKYVPDQIVQPSKYVQAVGLFILGFSHTKNRPTEPENGGMRGETDAGTADFLRETAAMVLLLRTTCCRRVGRGFRGAAVGIDGSAARSGRGNRGAGESVLAVR